MRHFLMLVVVALVTVEIHWSVFEHGSRYRTLQRHKVHVHAGIDGDR